MKFSRLLVLCEANICRSPLAGHLIHRLTDLAVDSAVDASEKRHAVICAQHLLEEVLAALADAAEIRLIQMKSIRTRRMGRAVALCLVVVLAAKARVDQVVSVVVRPAVAVVLPGVEEVLPAASRRERETCLEDVRNLRWC